jgi:hypothetical protein
MMLRMLNWRQDNRIPTKNTMCKHSDVVAASYPIAISFVVFEQANIFVALKNRKSTHTHTHTKSVHEGKHGNETSIAL